jgi:hypothetical protein
LVGALFATKSVIFCAYAIQADAYFGEASILYFLGLLLSDKGTVGGQCGSYTVLAGKIGQLEYILSEQRLTAGKENHRHAKVRQVMDE